MYRKSCLGFFFALALAAAECWSAPVLAEVAEKPAAQDDAVKAAFLAMPEPDRLAVQDALGWLGLYNGNVDGAYGKRTGDAIEAYQKKQNLKPDGVVTAEELAALKVAAEKARAAVGFDVVEDANTGERISAPLKLIDKRKEMPGLTTIANADNTIALEMWDFFHGDVTLEDMYKKQTADAEGRKIVYKALKPDAFFVVTGEDAGGKFYERYVAGAAGSPEAGKLRAFVFRYPKARSSELDRVALAMATSFAPFGGPTKTAKPIIAPVATPSAPPGPAATAFIIKPGVALTALKGSECAKPMVLGKPAAYVDAGSANGLALLSGEFGANVEPAALGGATTEALVLSLGPGAEADKPALQASEAALTPLGEGMASLMVAVSGESARGAPAFDAEGRLVAMLAPLSAPPRRVGAVAIAEPRAAFGVEVLAPLVGASSQSGGGTLSAGEIAKKFRARIVAVRCAT